MKSYPKMKDSGMDWIGKIPEHWEVTSIKKLGDIITGNTPPTENESNFGEDFPWVNPEDLNSNMYIEKTNKKLSKEGFTLARKVPAKSVMVSCIGNIGKIGISKVEMSTNQQINSIVCKKNVPEFVYFQIRANSDALNQFANKTVISILNKNDFGNFKIVKPNSIEEQKAVVKFLSIKNNLINLKIKQNQKLVELLQEKRKILINNSITKGLDSSVEMKNSNINWINKIPKQWEIKKFKFITDRIVVGIAESTTEYYREVGTPLIFSANVKPNRFIEKGIGFIDRKLAEKNKSKYLQSKDILTVRTGANVGDTAVVPEKYSGAQCFTLLISSVKKGNESKFFCYYINSDFCQNYFKSVMWGAAQNNLSVPIIKEIRTPVPNKDKQKEIVDFLGHKTSEIDLMISNIKLQIKKLQEYSHSLMISVVTGKIDVREAIA